METVSETRCFDGVQGVYRHESTATGTPMRFAVYLPPQARRGPVPVLWWLSGLTCTEENFITKAGAQRYAAEHGLALVAPDTSPRGLDLPGEHDAYDFGSGAGFYVDATQAPWASHYRMDSYVTEELPALVAARFPVDPARQGIFGHSMGGHGALVMALRDPDRFRSVSAFAPIVSPTRVPWGEKAFAGYLGDDRAAWTAYDAAELAADSAWRAPILIDQGDADPFLGTQLTPEAFVSAAQAGGIPVTLRMQPGYDHSYYFIASFMADHMAHHARLLAR
ncbi:S-formylglutathione hydrolase [Roseospira navarrensis]|uniref:S-formylglutathione hydrolase n=1 Tax=Roseospira navarrensis TaxID=140058 RepID=A0A7X2D2G3_9PROT|nr:S-formylglutathione hydrolase [Roseospira navarrensis]MQX36264.1 S-formylglutathione hydrolase [Roseospira navarrensis]